MFKFLTFYPHYHPQVFFHTGVQFCVKKLQRKKH